MAGTNATRDGESRRTALLIVDMINPLDFEGAESLCPHALEAAGHIATLAGRMRGQELPVIYVNDNFMHWQADFSRIVEICAATRGAAVAEKIEPRDGDYFVLKPKHSGFLATPLEILLEKLEVGRVIVTGMATDGCVLATATDAHMREYDVNVPADCVAAITRERTDRALALMEASMHIDVRPSGELRP